MERDIADIDTLAAMVFWILCNSKSRKSVTIDMVSETPLRYQFNFPTPEARAEFESAWA